MPSRLQILHSGTASARLWATAAGAGMAVMMVAGEPRDDTQQKISKAKEARKRSEAYAEEFLGNKTVASDDEKTLSGWGDPPEGYSQATPEEVQAYSKEIGHELTPAGGLDQFKRGGFPGKYNASHAEKQLALRRPNEPIGVSKAMCPDCQNFFKFHAKHTGKPQVVSDPEVTRVFNPDGTVTEIPN